MTDFGQNATPRYIFDCLTRITTDDLKKMNVKVIAVDLDNTSVYDCTMTPIKGVKKWIKMVKDAGYKIIFISNSFELRARLMGKIFGCHSYGPAEKPDTKMLLEAVNAEGVNIHETALIGDRLFTDVVCANQSGAVSVYVKPYRKEFMIPFYWKKARQDEIDYLKTINVERNLKTIYYK